MLIFDSMRCSAQTTGGGLDAGTINAGLRMLVSEIRAQGIDSPLLNFRQFLQYVAPWNNICAGLYQEVSLAEWSERMGGHASHSVAGHEPRDDSPSLSVLVWVGGGGAGGGGGGAQNAGGLQGAVTVLQPASKETLTAVRGGNDYARWLASCARIVTDTSARMLLLKPLPVIIAGPTTPAGGHPSNSEVVTSLSELFKSVDDEVASDKSRLDTGHLSLSPPLSHAYTPFLHPSLPPASPSLSESSLFDADLLAWTRSMRTICAGTPIESSASSAGTAAAEREEREPQQGLPALPLQCYRAMAALLSCHERDKAAARGAGTVASSPPR